MRAPQISVLLCAYNPDKEQLQLAVKSIINQSFTDWEMILYDDGSEQEYQDLIYNISCMDDRIRYVRNEEHHSLAYGLNYSIKLARGKYIARMDADDISKPQRFQRQIQFLEEHTEYMWVGSNITVIDEEGKKQREITYPVVPNNRDFLKYSPYAHPSVMVRKEPLISHGGYGKGEKPCRSEDYELFMRLHAKGEQGANIQEILLDYRESEYSYARRKFYFQLQEVMVRIEGFFRLGILTPGSFVYIIKPIVVWMIPNKLLYAIKKERTV